MALPQADVIQTAYQAFSDAFVNDKTLRGMRHAVARLNWLGNTLNRLYTVIDYALTADDDDAGVSELLAAEATLSVGTIFRIKSATPAWDLTDNALGTAKNAEGDGAIVALNDIYVVSGADAVVYLGNNINDDGNSVPFDFAGEQVADFMNIS